MADGIFGPPPIPDDAIAACRLPNAEPAPVKFPPPVGGDFGLIVIASSFIWPIGPTGLLFAAFGSFFGAVMSPKLSTFEFNAAAHGSFGSTAGCATAGGSDGSSNAAANFCGMCAITEGGSHAL